MTNDTPFLERDLSWLSFNERVLLEAQDKSVPLYERIKFLAIYSSNLDEFFRVRVASLRSFRKLEKATKKEMHLKPRKLLRQIRSIVQAQQAEFGRTFREEIVPELAKNKIFLVNEGQFNEEQQAFAAQFFSEKIAPLLQPVFLENGEVPFLENKALYFVLQFENESALAILKLPTAELGRFIVLPGNKENHYVAFLDDLLRCGLLTTNVVSHAIGVANNIISGAWAIKTSRDAEMYIDDEYAGDLLEKIRQGLEERHIGLPTRFLYDASMPESLLTDLRRIFSLSKNDVIPGARYHNFNDFFAFPDPAGLPGLFDEPMVPLPHPALDAVPSLFEALENQDFLLHFPYQKFDYVLRFIEEAANDPAVESLKITLYRVASKSAVCEALLKALANGKKVFAFIEAKARFDEETNLFWGEKLAQAGATIRYSIPGIKIHSKMLLIKRGKRRFGWIATGNFNEKTATLYADHALLTADPRLTEEAAQVFDILEGKIILPKAKHLLIAPFTLRERFEKLMDKEIENARAGTEAWMFLKMNSLEDPQMMQKLIEASQAGVKIRLIVRGICRLAPGMKGFTENIEIISVIDRFLEHARVYIFANGGKEKTLLASADWMTRNLDRRIEVGFPLFDEKLAAEVRQVLDFQWNDNVKARALDGKFSNRRRRKKKGEEEVRSQVETYKWLSLKS